MDRNNNNTNTPPSTHRAQALALLEGRAPQIPITRPTPSPLPNTRLARSNALALLEGRAPHQTSPTSRFHPSRPAPLPPTSPTSPTIPSPPTSPTTTTTTAQNRAHTLALLEGRTPHPQHPPFDLARPAFQKSLHDHAIRVAALPEVLLAPDGGPPMLVAKQRVVRRRVPDLGENLRTVVPRAREAEVEEERSSEEEVDLVKQVRRFFRRR